MGFKATTHSRGVLSRPLREASAEEMRGVSSEKLIPGQSWVPGCLCLRLLELEGPLETIMEAMPPLLQTGKQRLRDREWLAQGASISDGTGRDSIPGP